MDVIPGRALREERQRHAPRQPIQQRLPQGDYDFAMFKRTAITERFNLEFRAEAFNVFNHHQYGLDPFTSTGIGAPVDDNPNDFSIINGVSTSTFGRIQAAHPGRIIQLGGKIVF